MALGLPAINVSFTTAAQTAVARSAKGIVALILKDSTVTTFNTKVYKNVGEISPTDWTAENLDYIQKTFLGSSNTPTLIVERLAEDAAEYTAALARLANKTFNYLAVPGILDLDAAIVATWVKAQRTSKKTFKAVLPNTASDHEAIINFTTNGIKVGANTYTASQYTARIAGLLAGLSNEVSATYYTLPEVTEITESNDPNADVVAGKLILINDIDKIRIARGVNSLQTTSTTKSEAYKKIRIIEIMDLIANDIRNTFKNDKVGKIICNYRNKIVFATQTTAYFKQLANTNILDSDFNNICEVDIEAQTLYLQGIGLNTNVMDAETIKQYNTGDTAFLKATIKIADTMENLEFGINI